MNKITTIFLAILGGCHVFMDITTPIVISLIWGQYIGFDSTSSIIILFVGGLATLFRGIKRGWIKK